MCYSHIGSIDPYGNKEGSVTAVKSAPRAAEKLLPKTMNPPVRKVAPGLTTCTPEAVRELHPWKKPEIIDGAVIVRSGTQVTSMP